MRGQTFEVPANGTLTIHEYYSVCTAGLLSIGPKNGGGRLAIVSEHDGTSEQVLDAKDIKAAGSIVGPDS
jgi:hypothetical protein